MIDTMDFSGQMHVHPGTHQEHSARMDILLQNVISQARALNIPISDHIHPHVRINQRATGRFGACFSNKRSGTFLIEISDMLLQASEKVCCQTLAHEVLHTCHGCQNHKKRWHRYADMMNQAYGYTIRRTDSPERLGVESKAVVRYVVVCTICGAEIPRSRKSKLILHPEDYRCAKCGGRLLVKYPEGEKDDEGTV